MVKRSTPTQWSSAHLTSSRAWKSAAPTLQAANMNSSSRRLIHFHMVDRSVFLLSPVLCSGRLKPSEERAGDSDGCSMIDLHYKISFAIFGENIYGRLKLRMRVSIILNFQKSCFSRPCLWSAFFESFFYWCCVCWPSQTAFSHGPELRI